MGNQYTALSLPVCGYLAVCATETRLLASRETGREIGKQRWAVEGMLQDFSSVRGREGRPCQHKLLSPGVCWETQTPGTLDA